jgi:ribosomal protein L20A (L18A)
MTARFKYVVVDRPDDAYYVTNWDRKTPVEVVAENREAALEQVWVLMGAAPRHRHWVARLLSVEVVPDANAGDIAARALEEAADTWQTGEWANAPRHANRVADRLGAAQHVSDWLRARAARLREGD